MRNNAIALAAVLVCMLGCGGASSPDAVVRKAIDAVENADGEALVGCLSSGGLAEIDAQIDAMKVNPEESAAYLAMMGIDVSPEEVENMDASELITWMLQSDMMKAELPDFGTLEIGEPVIAGDFATVPIVLEGESEEVELVLENGEWKLGTMLGM